MRHLVLTTALLGLLAGAARADLADAVGLARSALDSRQSALEGLLDPTKAERKELKKLGKALDRLVAYSGVDDEGDLAAILKAMGKIASSKTADPDVTDALAGIRDALDALAGERRAEAVDALATVKASKVAKVQRQIDKGDAKRSAGLTAWDGDPVRGADLLVGAIARYVKALAKALKYHEDPVPLVYVQMTKLYNDSDGVVDLIDIECTVTGHLGGAPYSYICIGVEVLPGTFPVLVLPHTSYDFLALATAAASSDPGRPEFLPGDFLAVQIVLRTSAGDFLSQLN
jgi:hypothetical protein